MNICANWIKIQIKIKKSKYVCYFIVIVLRYGYSGSVHRASSVFVHGTYSQQISRVAMKEIFNVLSVVVVLEGWGEDRTQGPIAELKKTTCFWKKELKIAGERDPTTDMTNEV